MTIKVQDGPTESPHGDRKAQKGHFLKSKSMQSELKPLAENNLQDSR